MSRPTEPLTRTIVASATILITGVLLFTRLGHYALWDDEAYTGLNAEGILSSGDTSAVLGHNIAAFHDGMVLRNLRDRVTPPLPNYLAAISIGFLGKTAFAARLPFAIAGLFCVGIMMFWMWREAADLPAMLVGGMAIIGNISLTLYYRQSRYYGLAILLSVVIAYLYLHHDRRRLKLIALSLALVALVATNYLIAVATYVCLLLDYALWGRKRLKLSWRDVAILLAPQLLLGLPLVAIFHPPSTAPYGEHDSTLQRLHLIWISLRDLNRCEFAPMLLIVSAPVLYWFNRNIWLVRGVLAIIVFCVVTALASPQILHAEVPLSQQDADVRYLVSIIPLGIAISTMVLCSARGKLRWVVIALAPFIFFTNVLNQAAQLRFHPSSALWNYIGELRHPPTDPYTVTSEWINQHLQEGQSIWVLSGLRGEPAGYQTYPLMFHAPKAVYAWQLSNPPAAQFEHLPEIHFFGRIWPDYLISFGPLFTRLQLPAGVVYDEVAILDVFPHDVYRPELFWRSFSAIPADPAHGAAVFIFQRRTAAAPPMPAQPQPAPVPSPDFHL